MVLGRLPLLSTKSMVKFPAAEHHWPLASTKLYCLVTGARVCVCVNKLPRVVHDNETVESVTPQSWFDNLTIKKPRHTNLMLNSRNHCSTVNQI